MRGEPRRRRGFCARPRRRRARVASSGLLRAVIPVRGFGAARAFAACRARSVGCGRRGSRGRGRCVGSTCSLRRERTALVFPPMLHDAACTRSAQAVTSRRALQRATAQPAATKPGPRSTYNSSRGAFARHAYSVVVSNPPPPPAPRSRGRTRPTRGTPCSAAAEAAEGAVAVAQPPPKRLRRAAAVAEAEQRDLVFDRARRPCASAARTAPPNAPRRRPARDPTARRSEVRRAAAPSSREHRRGRGRRGRWRRHSAVRSSPKFSGKSVSATSASGAATSAAARPARPTPEPSSKCSRAWREQPRRPPRRAANGCALERVRENTLAGQRRDAVNDGTTSSSAPLGTASPGGRAARCATSRTKDGPTATPASGSVLRQAV